MLDLSCANNGLSWLVPTFGERCNIWNVPGRLSAYVQCDRTYHLHSEDIDVWVLDLFKSVQPREESTPENNVSF
jgi:hypothetical protein